MPVAPNYVSTDVPVKSEKKIDTSAKILPPGTGAANCGHQIRGRTVLPANGNSDVMFCLIIYQGLIIDRSLLY